MFSFLRRHNTTSLGSYGGRGLLVLFVATILLPGLLLCAFSVRGLLQERRLAGQQVREQLERIATETSRSVEFELHRWQQLVDEVHPDVAGVPTLPAPLSTALSLHEGAVLLVLSGRGRHIVPSGRLLYDPGVASLNLPSPVPVEIASVETLELRQEDYGKAIRAYEALLPAASPSWRPLLLHRLARTSRKAGRGDIHIAAVDGTRRSLLVGGIAKDQVVDWSPDGKSLLFTSDRGSTRGLWRIRVENMAAVGEPEILQADLGSMDPVNVAQDGTILGDNWQKKSDAWMTALDLANGKVTGARTLVTNTPAGLTEFAGWSPDGSKAAAIGFKTLNAFDGRTLVIRPTRGGAETRIDLDGSLAPSPSLRWASVGDQLLVGISSGPGGTPGAVDVQTGHVTKVNIPAKFTSGPGVFSPDGRCYFAATRQPEVAKILMYDIVSKTEKEILLDREAWLIHGPSPSPDGKRLAYSVHMAIMQNGKRVGSLGSYDDRLRVLDVESGTVTEVAAVRTSTWGSRLNTAWTPDGRSLIFAREGWEGEAEAGKSALFIVPSAGGEPKPISELEEGRTFDLGVSPDRTMLGYTHFKEAGNFWLIQDVLPKR